MSRGAILAVLLAPAPLFAAPPEVPRELKAPPGQIAEVVAKVAADAEIGFVLVGDGAVFRELKSTSATERVWWFSAPKAGTYTVVWWTKGETAGATTTITVGDPPKPPPPPNDPLRQKIREAYLTDKASPNDAQQLAALYQEAAKLAASADVPSSAELLRRIREAGANLLPGGVLAAVRKVVASELAAALGKSNDDPLTAVERAKAAELFATLATILEEIAK